MRTEKQKRKMMSIYKKLYYEKNREKLIIKCRLYFRSHKAYYKSQSGKYYINHREYLKKQSRQYRKLHREEYREYDRRYKKIWILKKQNFINKRMGIAIYKALRGYKNRQKWEDLVGYTKHDLINHLEKLFVSGMSWNNYGLYWHIDHIIPKMYFKYKTPNDTEFKQCWSLANLQPLEATKNRIKGGRWYYDRA